ncbi:MAG TPA: hypothetical protein VGK91_06950 [Candidatus Udaeobacter sp.]|jgi:histidinol phosphatase-like enzyme
MAEALPSAIFIDRDGTIMEDTDYCSGPKADWVAAVQIILSAKS